MLIVFRTVGNHGPPPPPPQDSRTQLFVSNLPFRVRWQDLVRFFQQSQNQHSIHETESLPLTSPQKDLMRKCGTVLRVSLLEPSRRLEIHRS